MTLRDDTFPVRLRRPPQRPRGTYRRSSGSAMAPTRPRIRSARTPKRCEARRSVMVRMMRVVTVGLLIVAAVRCRSGAAGGHPQRARARSQRTARAALRSPREAEREAARPEGHGDPGLPEHREGGLPVRWTDRRGRAASKNGKTVAYYNSVAASYGLQAGVQTFGYALFFMNDGALATSTRARASRSASARASSSSTREWASR